MPCKCENPKEIEQLVLRIETASDVVNIVSQKCVGYHLVDGVDEFALLGLTGEERELLIRSGWVRINNSYMWFKHEEEKI